MCEQISPGFGTSVYPRFAANRQVVHSRPTFTDKLHVTFIAGYIAFAGIYWLPGISFVLISQIKIVLYAVFVAIGLLRLKIYSARQLSIYVWLAIGALAAFIANSITSDLETAIDQARNFIEPLLWLVALFAIRSRAYPLLLSRLTVALTIFFLISLYPVGVYIGLLPNFYAPSALIDPTGLNLDNRWVLEAASIVGGGFNGGSTGWGVTVATTSLLAAALYLRGRMTKGWARLIAAVIVAGSAASIVVTGARGGVFALVAVVAYGVTAARGVRVLGVFLVVGFLLLILSINLTTFLPERFLRNFDATGNIFTRLNTMTTGRLESDVGGLKHFAESPIIGKGPMEAKVWINNAQYVSVHNLWIKALAESGLVLFLPVIVLTTRLVSLIVGRGKISQSTHNHLPSEWPNTYLVLLVGLVMAMAEPGVVIGSFNTNAVFWMAVWFELVRRRNQTSPAMHKIAYP